MTGITRNVAAGLFGALLGAAAVTGLWAQTKAPVYIVIDISEITDADAMSKAVASPAAAAGARFMVRTQKATQLDGGAGPARFAIAAFDSEEKAKEWFNSPPIAAINATRLKATKSRAFLVEGLPNRKGLGRSQGLKRPPNVS